ncbi:hypothetical protein BDV33DRAFT_48919 [Aspergillus novoparasiticus]|uniref:Uncharacterized protein n=1 Tax=Aspergillus novoparasiticus TaxID=986946 RepID=A0A5N6EAF1_9EURO|nr:hypothetical protein BDV33DRAFT_48919 [Aspergillus novoparasiticus]
MSQASPRAVVSSTYWDTEREFWQSEESLVQGELVIRNLDDGDSGEADLSQPFDIRWQTFSPNENIFGEEVTARVTMENGKLKSQANHDSELVTCHCLIFSICGAFTRISPEVATVHTTFWCACWGSLGNISPFH